MTTKRIGKSRCIQWFQTFPQWPRQDKEELYDTLIKPLGVQYVNIVEETHEDGGIHYHVAFILNLAKTKPQLVRYYKNKLPNDYVRCTVMRALEPFQRFDQVSNYLDKEDPSPFIIDKRPNPYDSHADKLGCYNYQALRREVAPRVAREQLVRDALAKYDSDFQHAALPQHINVMFEFFRKHDSMVFHDLRYSKKHMAQFIAVSKTILQ